MNSSVPVVRKLRIHRRAEKKLRRVPSQIRQKIANKLEELRESPTPHGAVKLETTKRLWRIRHGDYRVIYQFSDTEITVLQISHRQSAYKDLKHLRNGN